MRATNPANANTQFAAISGSPLVLLTYPGPISNDPVALQFQQQIGSTDALRTLKRGCSGSPCNRFHSSPAAKKTSSGATAVEEKPPSNITTTTSSGLLAFTVVLRRLARI